MIRRALPSEYPKIIESELDLFDSDWITIEDCQNNDTFVLIDSSQIIGHYISSDRQQYLFTLAVYKQFHGKGLSRLLLEHFIQQGSNHSLHVNVNNYKAIQLYKSFGFKLVELEFNFYGNGDNAYLMEKHHKE